MFTALALIANDECWDGVIVNEIVGTCIVTIVLCCDLPGQSIGVNMAVQSLTGWHRDKSCV